MDQRQEPPLLFARSPMPESEQPVNRVMEGNAEYMTDTELLSVLLRLASPDASLEASRSLLGMYGSLVELSRLPPSQIMTVPGIGKAGACTVHAAFALGRRMLHAPCRDQHRLEAPDSVAEHLASGFIGKVQEEFHVLLLDSRNCLIRDETVTIGLADRTQVHAREVFRQAIRENACRVILAHNHPSGDPTPSPQDIDCTRSLVAAGKVIGIEILDHVVVGTRSPSRPRYWLSFREANLL
jgi:DNA repair protein RadC